jgi:phage portal protein BeeE
MNTWAFYANITTLARKVAMPRLHIFAETEDGREEIKDHEYLKILRRPNPICSGTYLMQYSMAWLGLDGNAYWWLARSLNGRGPLREIWPIPARECRPMYGKGDDVLSHYEWQRGGEDPVRIPPQMIAHFRLVNPYSILHGRGFIPALCYIIEGAQAELKWNYEFFHRDNAVVETVITFPSGMHDEDFARMRELLLKEHGGGKRRPLVGRAMHSGEKGVDVARLGLTQEEMAFLGGLEFKQKAIDRVCGFPEGYWSMKANRANSEAAERSLARDVIAPVLKEFAEVQERDIIDPEFEQKGQNLICEYDNVVPADRELDLQEYEAHAPVRTVDEARVAQGLEPLGGELGETLVSFLPALGQAAALGLAPTGEPTTDGSDSKILDELRTWQQVASKRAAKGLSPGSREFVSEHIPGHVKANIEAALQSALEVDDVRAVFTPWVRNGHTEVWEGYP